MIVGTIRLLTELFVFWDVLKKMDLVISSMWVWVPVTLQQTAEGQSVGCHNARRTGCSHVHTVSRDGQRWKREHGQLQTRTSEFMYLDKYTYF